MQTVIIYLPLLISISILFFSCDNNERRYFPISSEEEDNYGRSRRSSGSKNNNTDTTTTNEDEIKFPSKWKVRRGTLVVRIPKVFIEKKDDNNLKLRNAINIYFTATDPPDAILKKHLKRSLKDTGYTAKQIADYIKKNKPSSQVEWVNFKQIEQIVSIHPERILNSSSLWRSDSRSMYWLTYEEAVALVKKLKL